MGKEDKQKEQIEKDMLTDKQLENVIGGMSPERFRQWREKVLNEGR
jgi:bacteriocin-like protein